MRNVVALVATLLAFGLAQQFSYTAAAGPPRAAEDTARAYLRANAEALGLDPSLRNLELVTVQHSLTGAHVRFQQTLDGIPIDGAVVIVHMDAAGDPAGVTNDYYPAARVRANESTPDVSTAGAKVEAVEAVGAEEADRRKPSSELVYARDGTALRLAWRTTFATSQPFGNWEVDVDAATGETLSQRDVRLMDSGRVFDPSPAVPTAAPGSYCNVGNYLGFRNRMVSKSLLGINEGQGYLTGQYVDLTAPELTDDDYEVGVGWANSLDHIYNYDCDQDLYDYGYAFNEVMVYYHVDSAQRYLQSLGFTGVNTILGFAVPAHANYFVGCNAYYNDTLDDFGLHFGVDSDGFCGFRDAAEDADVIVHEYGHAVLDSINQDANEAASDVKGTFEGRALHEGFGDLLSAAYTQSPCSREWFEHGAANPPQCGRSMDNAAAYDDFVSAAGMEHSNGQIWTGAMWDVVVAAGNDADAWGVATTLATESAQYWGSTPTFSVTANAMMHVDRLLYGGAHVAAIAAAFTGRGIAVDTTAPTASLSITTPAQTASRDVDLTLSGGDAGGSGASHYLVTESATPPSPADAGWQVSSPTTFHISAPGDGEKTLHGWTKDGAGNVSDASSATITLETGAPTVIFTIAETATAGTVTVAFDSPDTDITRYLVTATGEAPLYTAPGWSPTPPTTAQLTGDDGPKTLYGWVKDGAQNVSAPSSASSDSTLLDATAPAATFAITPPVTNGTAVAVTLSGADSGTGVDAYCVKASAEVPSKTDGCFAAQAPTTAVLSGSDGTKTLYAFTRDAVGNVSEGKSDTVVLDRARPTATLNIVPTATRAASAAISFTGSDVNGSGVNGYCVRSSSTTPMRTDPCFLTSPPASVALGSPEGLRTFHVWTRDIAGNVSLTATDSVRRDTTAPAAAFSILPSATRTTTVAVSFAGTDTGGSGVNGYCIRASSAVPPATDACFKPSRPTTAPIGAPDGIKPLFAFARDFAGNVSAAESDFVRLDTKAPASRVRTPAGSTVSALSRFGGTAADTGGSGVKQVLVSLRRELTATSCEHWNGNKWMNLGCSRVIWLKATGTGAWTFALPRQTTPGRYVLQSVSQDRVGNKETKFVNGVNMRRFTIR